MENCGKSTLPWGWVPQCDPLPSDEVLVLYTIFDFLVLLLIYLLYQYSTINTGYNTKLAFRNLSQYPKGEVIYSGIKLSFFGLGISSLNNLLSHASPLLFDQAGYLFLGYYSIFLASGLIILLMGLYQYNNFFINQHVRSDIISKVLIFLLFPMGIAFTAFFTNSFNPPFQSTLTVIVYIVLFINISLLISTAIYYIIKSEDLEEQIPSIRMKLLALTYLLYGIILGWGGVFVPYQDRLLIQYDTVNLFMIGLNILLITYAFVLYLIPALPDWFRLWMDIDEQEFIESTYDLYGIDPPNTVHIDIKPFADNPNNIPYLENLRAGYLLFLNIPEDRVVRPLFINLFKSKTNIIEIFDTSNTKDQFFSQKLNTRSNLIFLANEIDEGLDNLVDRIYESYNWDINYHKGVIYFNNYPYKVEDTEFALIFSGPSMWNFKHHIYFMLFREELSAVMLDFLENFYEFLEYLTTEHYPYVMILFFDVNDNGKPVNIPHDDQDGDQPDDDHYRIFS